MGKVKGESQVIGTGFFVNEFGVFVTAKHCLEEIIDDGTYFKIVQRLNKSTLLRTVTEIYSHPYTDICLGTTNYIDRPINQILGIDFTPPEVGDELFTVAYPETILDNDGKWNFYLSSSIGRYIEYCIEKPESRFNAAIIRTSINLRGGVSGGPVFKNNKVIDVNSIGLI